VQIQPKILVQDNDVVMASTVNHVIAPHNPVIINGLQVFSPTNASDISTPTGEFRKHPTTRQTWWSGLGPGGQVLHTHLYMYVGFLIDTVLA